MARGERRPAPGLGARSGVVVTCEHAARAVPAGLSPGLGVSREVLRSHVAWDPGARALAVALAERLEAPLLVGAHTRLLVDLNRSRRNRAVVPHTSFGVPVPGNRALTAEQRAERIERYWQPYRQAVERAIDVAVARGGACLHLSVHTFVAELDGAVRDADVGLLYDPSRGRERALARAVASHLRERGRRVRMNYPYRGTSDGLTTHLRKRFAERRYAGLELEVNQRALTGSRNLRRIARDMGEAVAAAVSGDDARDPER